MTQKPCVVLLLILIMFSPANGHSFDNAPMVRTVTIDVDGISLSARLYPALSSTPGAGLVLLHGWSWPENDPATGLVLPAREFQRAGFTVLVPSMRGWPPSGGVDDCAGKQVNDVLLALQWLGQQPEVDMGQRYLAGFSQGGQVALLAASHDAPVQGVAAFAATALTRTPGWPGMSWLPVHDVQIVPWQYSRTDCAIPVRASSRPAATTGHP